VVIVAQLVTQRREHPDMKVSIPATASHTLAGYRAARNWQAAYRMSSPVTAVPMIMH
jgi:hypothetical protein